MATRITIIFDSRLNREKTKRITAIGIIIHFDMYSHDNAAQIIIRTDATSINIPLALANPCLYKLVIVN